MPACVCTLVCVLLLAVELVHAQTPEEQILASREHVTSHLDQVIRLLEDTNAVYGPIRDAITAVNIEEHAAIAQSIFENSSGSLRASARTTKSKYNRMKAAMNSLMRDTDGLPVATVIKLNSFLGTMDIDNPPVATEAPPEATEAPPEATESPPEATETPPEATEAPPIVTDPPVVSTEPPVVPTEPPVIPTDPPVLPTDLPAPGPTEPATSSDPCEVGGDNYYIGNGICYYVLPEGKMGWYEGRRRCQEMGMDLASPITAAQQQYIARNIITPRGGRDPHYWIGLHRGQPRGWVWKPLNDRRLSTTYKNWHPNQPNDWTGTQNCVAMWDHKKWNDLRCWVGRYIICQKYD